MSDLAYGISIRVDRPGPGNRHGEAGPGSSHTVEGCAVAPRGSSEQRDGRDTVTTGLTLYGPYDIDLEPTDTVHLPGDAAAWYVEGDVGRWGNPHTGDEAGSETALTRTRG